VNRTPVVLDMGHYDLTNRVNYDAVCSKSPEQPLCEDFTRIVLAPQAKGIEPPDPTNIAAHALPIDMSCPPVYAHVSSPSPRRFRCSATVMQRKLPGFLKNVSSVASH
jgi:hypothetical protein